MLQLKNVVKHYEAFDMTVKALKGVDLDFRKSEFVAILGPSGCGKTTLLNIVGGLDRYTSGDLVIDNVSTTRYKDTDWDIYRNNSIGFVFQSYNLIPHQNALANVELAMTLSGVSKSERRKRAKEALEKVGLGDQIYKRPNQMSGGQMQRVAIARALCNNPSIILADEPTGALDSENSIQVMDILKEVARDRLVIIVTHNAEIAAKYASRTIRLLDGKVIDDTNPYRANEEQEAQAAKKCKKKKRTMSFFTALSLSLNNLMTKKTRTFLTAFAGSIGIIGIALILSLSSGMQGYIKTMETDTMSTYPLQIQSRTVDMSGMMSMMMSLGLNDREHEREYEPGMIYSRNIAGDMLSSMSEQITINNLRMFKDYIESGDGQKLYSLTNSIKYGYSVEPQIYKADTTDGIIQVNPSTVFDNMGASGGNTNNNMNMSMGSTMGFGNGGVNNWSELLGNDELLRSQYDCLDGVWPSAYDEIVFVVNENNEISDLSLYSLGLLDASEFEEIAKKAMRGESVEKKEPAKFSYDEILSLTFKVVLNTDYYVKINDHWEDMRDDSTYMRDVLDNALEIKVVGILRPKENATATSINSAIGYTAALTEYIIGAINNADIVKEQIAAPEINVFTGIAFDVDKYVEELTMDDVYRMLDEQAANDSEREQMNSMFAMMPEEQILAAFRERLRSESSKDTYESNCETLGVVDYDNPGIISLYPKDFASKKEITDIIASYNKIHEDAGNDEYVLKYTDVVELMTSSISSIIDIVTYVLIAFVAISLVVSSIMIAIITYISVLERTKEIGILRSIGASKRDISRVFNAETIIEGLVAGSLGVGVTILLNFPVNTIIKSVAGVSDISALPVYGIVGLIALSITLTVIAGFVPSKMAAKKDPVAALRAE